MRFAYGDPPYLGCAHLYPEHPDAVRWDDPLSHVMAMAELDAEYDAWAFSLSVPSLKTLLPRTPEGSRVAAWVKPFASFKPGVDPAYTWEPVIFRSARQASRGQLTCRDHVSANITLKRGLTGAKPDGFWFWLFESHGSRAAAAGAATHPEATEPPGPTRDALRADAIRLFGDMIAVGSKDRADYTRAVEDITLAALSS